MHKNKRKKTIKQKHKFIPRINKNSAALSSTSTQDNPSPAHRAQLWGRRKRAVSCKADAWSGVHSVGRPVPWMCTPSTWVTVWMGTHITLELLTSWLSLQETALPSHLLQSREWSIYTCMYTHAVLSTKGWPPPENKLFWWDSPDQDPNLHSSPTAPWPQPQFNTIRDAKGSINLSFRKIHTVYDQRKNRHYIIFKTN